MSFLRILSKSAQSRSRKSAVVFGGESVTKKILKCPKCGAKLEDCSVGDEWGWFSDAPYRCSGHYIGKYSNVSADCALNRTKSCGYFAEEDLQDADIS